MRIFFVLFILFGLLHTASAATLNVTKIGGGTGSILSVPGGISCGSACQSNFASGTSVTLSVQLGPDEVFTGWTNGSGSASICSGTTSCTFTITQDSSVQAVLTPITFTLTCSITGSGYGDVKGALNCSRPNTSQVQLAGKKSYSQTATPTSGHPNGSTFKRWVASGSAANCNNSTSPTCAFVLTGPATTNAEFSLIPKVFITIILTGNREGKVVIEPGGVVCHKFADAPETCATNYTPGTKVKLTATPTQTLSEFKGWFSGSSAAPGNCNTSTRTFCELTLNAATSLTGKFCRPVTGCSE
jgi:hypothetical protein